MFDTAALSGSKTEQYAELAAQARGLLAGECDRTANAANLSSLVFHALPDVNWVGFYFHDGNELVVGPFQGRPACVRIALGKGVCGTAWADPARCRRGRLPRAHSLRFRVAFRTGRALVRW